MSTKTLTLGFSPCPNDTFIFYALVNGKVDTGGLGFSERLEDVETLNLMASRGELDVTKVSYGALGGLLDEYCLLRSGGAMGRGCGPLLVAREKFPPDGLRGKTIAIPGRHTTAFLLLRLYDPELSEHITVMPFDRIMAAVRDEEVDAGLIIHESRFTYPQYGLTEVEDLGRWWEEKTGCPIPLGAIIARRALGEDVIAKADALINQSVLYAMGHGGEPDEYIKRHSQELDDEVIRAHIGLYVNDFSVDLGDEGTRAVEVLFDMAAKKGIMEQPSGRLFI